ncbi:Hypothetical predicted protein [Cloeon dipterum]|uniref:Saposin B-type domain-containing protein n=1 Tax=Cloeon dipterum TaxID=197152 RepID=A0A8S1CCF9_9INSE|nr:Hypothetical predicted protein [Cloeon dipterum]
MFSTALIPLLLLASVKGQSDSTTDCKKLDFSSLPETCCSNPLGSLLPTSKIPTACKASSKLLLWMNSYQLNNLQDQTLKNFIDPKSKAYLSTICNAAKFVQCVFKELFFTISDNILEAETISEHLSSLTTVKEWQTVIAYFLNPFLSADKGYKFTDILEDNFENVTCSSGTQSLIPLMFTQMIQSELIWMCPKLKEFTDSNKCLQKLKDFQYCDDKIYSPTAKGIFFFPQT